jgi:hypothetical protein
MLSEPRELMKHKKDKLEILKNLILKRKSDFWLILSKLEKYNSLRENLNLQIKLILKDLSSLKLSMSKKVSKIGREESLNRRKVPISVTKMTSLCKSRITQTIKSKLDSISLRRAERSEWLKLMKFSNLKLSSRTSFLKCNKLAFQTSTNQSWQEEELAIAKK